MNAHRHMLFVFLFLTGVFSAYAQVVQQPGRQNPDRELQRLGIQYYQNNNYVKSLEIFNELYEKDPTHTNYTYTFYCLIGLRDYQEAEKFVRKHVRKNPGKKVSVSRRWIEEG